MIITRRLIQMLSIALPLSVSGCSSSGGVKPSKSNHVLSDCGAPTEKGRNCLGSAVFMDLLSGHLWSKDPNIEGPKPGVEMKGKQVRILRKMPPWHAEGEKPFSKWTSWEVITVDGEKGYA